jgi:hypothetical protein
VPARWDVADLQAVLRFLGRPGTSLAHSSTTTVELPWALLAADYLRFARTDLRGGSTRGDVNALGNAKRALHCRIDSVLYTTGFWKRAERERWDFADKEQLMAEIQIVAPLILRRINKLRNRVEHDYAAPDDRDQLGDFIDAVELFLAGTEHAASSRYLTATFVREAGGRSIEASFAGDPRLSVRLLAIGRPAKELRTRSFSEFRALQSALYIAAKRTGKIL